MSRNDNFRVTSLLWHSGQDPAGFGLTFTSVMVCYPVRKNLANYHMVKVRFADLGIDVAQSTPVELTSFTRAETDRFAKIIRDT